MPVTEAQWGQNPCGTVCAQTTWYNPWHQEHALFTQLFGTAVEKDLCYCYCYMVQDLA